jgi:hypothetical protein
MKYATAMSPARMNATGRVNKPSTINTPPTSSIMPLMPERDVGATPVIGETGKASAAHSRSSARQILCHPVKNAAADNLLPRGGGAFIAEVDGNLTANKDDSTVELHWQGKFRGPDFAPIQFVLKTVTHQLLKTSRGRLIPTVIASHLTEAAQEAMASATRSNEDKLLADIERNGKALLTGLAVSLGWYYKNGGANRTQVKRAADALAKAKLIIRERDGFAITDKGRQALRKEP